MSNIEIMELFDIFDSHQGSLMDSQSINIFQATAVRQVVGSSGNFQDSHEGCTCPLSGDTLSREKVNIHTAKQGPR